MHKVTVNRFFANIEVFFRATFIKCIFLLTDFIQMMKNKPNVRYLALGALLILVWLTQWIPALATIYSQTIYPLISYVLSFFSGLFPFAIGDLFIFLSITGVIVYPFYARLRKKLPWKKILLRDGEYLLWIYVWFYLAWGLNYSSKISYYLKTQI